MTANTTPLPGEGDRMTVVYTASGEVEAHSIRSALEAAGIPVELGLEPATKLFAVTVDGLGAVKVLVPENRVEEAVEIIETPARPVDEGAAEGPDDTERQ